MRTRLYLRFYLLGAVAIISIVLFQACDLRDVVFVERPFYEEPPEAALGFVGYDDQKVKLTVCGNCHVDTQSEWQATGHTDAWETLEASGHAQPFCENCHTVGPNGNPTDEGGWATTTDDRYHDVQCESCHGPGQAHINNPELGQPIASLSLGDLSDLSNAQNCAECHQGTHHPFAEEWAQSKHAQVVSFAAGREECAGCHRGQGALERWGVTSEYAEKDSPEHLPINCGVCHDPHNATNEGQLRLPIATTSIENNLCASCHNRRTVPDPGSSHGLEPHSPEAALLVGDAGWFPPNVNIEQGQIFGSHGSTANRKLCATCHVNKFEVTDEATGDFVFNATGHLFTSIPCLDASGVPTTDDDCALTVDARSFKGCATSGCHPSESDAADKLTSTLKDINALSEDLHALLDLVDPNGEDAGGAIDPGDPAFTVAEGAFFNYNLANFNGEATGSTTHNPYLVEALLMASIDAVEKEYGVSTGKTEDWKQNIQMLIAGLPLVQPIRRAEYPAAMRSARPF